MVGALDLVRRGGAGASAFLTLASLGAAQCTNPWSSVGSVGFDAPVYALLRLPNGDLLVGGQFTTIGGLTVNRIARWNGTTWSPMAQGFNGAVYALALLPNGAVVAAGQFSAAGGTTANLLARWNGTSWSSLGAGIVSFTQAVLALAVLPNGELVAGGNFQVTSPGVVAGNLARWNGSTWSAFPTGGSNDGVRALHVLPNGDLLAGGSFTMVGGVAANGLARWNGQTWSQFAGGVAGGLGSVGAIARHANGDLVVGGSFASAGGVAANHVARWNGTSWSPFGSGVTVNSLVTSLAIVPDGDVIVGGTFWQAGGSPANNIARWNGASWAAIGAGTLGYVHDLLWLPEGRLAVSGQFTGVGSVASSYFAFLETTCAASSPVIGAGCPSSVGTNSLVATELPWLGSTFRAVGTGLPTLAAVVAVTGTVAIPQGTAPLTLLLPPLGVPGCDLLAIPDYTELLLTATGTVTTAIPVPDSPSLVGAIVFHQLVPIELSPGLSPTAITATNALQLTVGAF